jgi:hypothetical protein
MDWRILLFYPEPEARELSKKGAIVYNKSHVNSLVRLVKDLKDPIILVWLGTCEITRKVDKYIKTYECVYTFNPW